jgi:hypothetical protein
MSETTLTDAQVADIVERVSNLPGGYPVLDLPVLVARVAGAMGSRAGYDAPWDTETMTTAVEDVLEACDVRGLRTWTASGVLTVGK